MSAMLEIRRASKDQYPDVFSQAAVDTLEAVAHLDASRKHLMAKRLSLRAARVRSGEGLTFLDPGAAIAGTDIRVADARAGRFVGSDIPHDLRRQWIQGTGPGAKPGVPLEKSIRNIAYALLSGADGWMFDGEDALGQLATMALDNQRNLALAMRRDEVFLRATEQVAREMNAWAQGFFGRPIIQDWKAQLDFTTKIFRPRGLHLDDRHVRLSDGGGFSASIVDATLFLANNHTPLQKQGASLVLYLPKIQTAEEAGLWNDLLSGIEQQLGLAAASVKTYVLVEQFEACFQLMEIRAVLGRRFVGFNTGRWDYINSVSDALSGDSSFVNPNIDAVTMTYGYMRSYEDRVRRAVNTPDLDGRFALWQGGMEPNIPVGSAAGVAKSMERALAGAEREQREGASGKWVAHWKMVHIVRPVWERVGQDNQCGRTFPPLTHTAADADALSMLEGGPRTVRGARDLISVAVQYGNAFGQSMQAAALKPADFFGNEDVLYLMEDMATGEIRLSILWEWLHKRAGFTEGDAAAGVVQGDALSPDLFRRLLAEEYDKLRRANHRDVHDNSKDTTLPIARDIVEAYVLDRVKLPWYIDLLNITLGVADHEEARRRIELLRKTFRDDGARVTQNLDF
jgi:malate synthase